MMKNDVLFYREVEVESYISRIYLLAVIFIFLLLVFIKVSWNSDWWNIIIGSTIFIILFLFVIFIEMKRIKAITVLNQNIFIDYFMINKEKRAIIDLENLKMDFDFFSSKNVSYFQLKFTSTKTWKLNSDDNWQLQDLKDIYLKIKEIKNEPLTNDEKEFIKKVDDKINDKGFFST